MNKKYFLFFALIVLSYSLRTTHLQEEQAAVETVQQPVNDAAIAEKKQAAQAYARLLQYIASDKALRKQVTKSDEPSDDQSAKIQQFMTKDSYFQKQLIQKIVEKPGNEWVKDINSDAQARYLKLTSSYSAESLNDESKRIQLFNKLLEDKDIGEALRNKFGDDVTAAEALNMINEEATTKELQNNQNQEKQHEQKAEKPQKPQMPQKPQSQKPQAQIHKLRRHKLNKHK